MYKHKNLLKLTGIAMLTLLHPACNHTPVVTPREHAYHRVQLYADEFTKIAIPFGPDSLTINESASIEINPKGWINIHYPAYNITINATINNFSSETINNRRERISRNLGDAPAEIAQFPAGIVVVAPAALHTPVQLLATDSTEWVFSAVAVTNFPLDAPADSVAPIINAVARDMSIMLKNLSNSK